MQTEMVQSHEMTEQMRQRRIRLWGKPKVVNLIVDKRRAEAIAKRRRSTLKGYVEVRSIELGYDVQTLSQPGVKKKLFLVRAQIMWEIKTHLRPDISMPVLGRLFGRDATTVNNSLRRHEQRILKGEI